MEKVPGFYGIYSKIFLKIMRTADLQESTQKCGKDFWKSGYGAGITPLLDSEGKVIVTKETSS